jgi:hypothetical protein
MITPKPTTFLTKLRRHGTVAVLAGITMVASACAQTRPAPAAGQDPFVISQSTNASLREYLAKISPNLRGAFAVSADGANSFYVYCPDILCSPGNFSGIATSQCRSLSGQECYLFYAHHEPRMAYTVATEKTPIGHHGFRRGRPLSELPMYNRN